MDEHPVPGTARRAGVKIEEGLGLQASNAQTKVQGKLGQAGGAAQDLYGQTADAARENRR